MLIKVGDFEFTEVFDGILPMKVKNEIVLKDWVEAIVIPAELREIIETAIPKDLSERVIYVENDCKDMGMVGKGVWYY